MKIANSKLVTYLLAFTLALGSLSIAASASAGEAYDFNTSPSGGDMMLDMFFLRPTMLIGSVLGTAAFIVTLPISALGGNVDESAETLVVEPVQYTFFRPLGEI